jgi:hypothetical protein
MRMTGVNIKERFADAIRRRGGDDRYIDRNEEREIVQIALQLGMTRDAAHADLARACADSGYVLETDIANLVRGRFGAVTGRDGRIDRRGFDELVAAARQAADGRQSDRELRRLVVTAIEDEPAVRVRRGWLRDWYKGVKRELGML